jgi:hypothetical protein
MMYTIRAATLADVDALKALIALSARQLSAGDYAPEQVEGALRAAFGVDTRESPRSGELARRKSGVMLAALSVASRGR